MNGIKKINIKNWFKKNYETLILFVFSCLFSLALVLSLLLYIPMQQTQNYTAGLHVNFISLFSVSIYILFVVVVFFLLQKGYIKIITSSLKFISVQPVRKYSFFRLSFLFNFFCWGIWFLTYYPGTGMNDTISLLMEPYSNSIPPLIYQMLIWYAMKFSMYFFHNMTLAYGWIVIMQMVFNAAVLAYVTNWLSKKQIRRSIIWAVLLYYALLPSVADYSITLVKDTNFSIFILLFVTQLYDVITFGGECLKNKKFLFAFIVTVFGVCTMRNNGSMVVIVTLMVFLFLKLKYKKSLAIILVLVLVFQIGIGFVEKQRFSSDVKFREMIGVPLAQIGAVLNDDTSKINSKELEVLNQVLPVDVWKENYRPSWSDPMKFNPAFNNDWLNEHKIEFLSTWASILKNNFSTYVAAYLCHSYGTWSVIPYFSNVDYTQSFFTKVNNNTGEDSIFGQFCSQNDLNNKALFPSEVNQEIQTFFKSSFTINLILSPGIMFWIVAALYAMLLAKKRYSICLVFLPILLVWFTLMVASPASFVYRYSFYLVLALPVILVLSLKELRTQVSSKSEKSKFRKSFTR